VSDPDHRSSGARVTPQLPTCFEGFGQYYLIHVKMLGSDEAEDRDPIGHIGEYPIYLSMLLAAVHLVALAGTCVALSLNAQGLLNALSYSSGDVLGKWWIWQFFTYVLVHVPRAVSDLVWFGAQIYICFWMGREIERFLGRRFLFGLYLALVLTPPVVLTLLSFIVGPTFFVDSKVLHLSLIIAYAVIYPSARVIFGFETRIVAAAILAGWTLYDLAFQQWFDMVAVWFSAAVAYGGVRWAGVGDGLNLFGGWRPRLWSGQTPKRVRVKALTGPTEFISDSQDALESVDSVLEKISQQGMASLTNSERATLERARASLLKRKGRAS
jgi:hypothetical protein